MTFAEMVKNREWEKIFDILDQGTIEKCWCLGQIVIPMILRVCPDTSRTLALREQTNFCWSNPER